MRQRNVPKIVVLGSINMDLMVRCQRLPRPGETVSALSFEEVSGGKGANQAVAAARAGGRVSMIGRLGDDGYSATLRANLVREGINCEGVWSTQHCPSGIAIVTVEASGENSIVVVPGANRQLETADVARHTTTIRDADCLLLQLEVPVASVLAAIRTASGGKVRVILTPAPMPADWNEELLGVDLICPNQAEASQLAGFSVDSFEAAERAARIIQQRGAKRVVITMGAQGAAALDGETFHRIRAFPTSVIDTTAAGDAFTGALAVCWAETNSLEQGLRFASVAAALTVSKSGAQPSLPTRETIRRLLTETKC